MPRSPGPMPQTSFAPGVPYWLASVVLMIRMTVAPVPIRRLLLRLRFRKRTIVLVFLAEVLMVGTVFVVIPIVVVLVATVIDLVLVLIVSTVLFLTSIVLRLARSTNCCWSGKGCGKNKRTEKISIPTVHVVFLLAQNFHLGILGSPGVCSDRPGSDVRFRTPASTTRIHSMWGSQQFGSRKVSGWSPSKTDKRFSRVRERGSCFDAFNRAGQRSEGTC
jgi:hypothetical protein